jgi:beta-D-galactosyl-(1->4)-L-rhamnose phosphorylase
VNEALSGLPVQVSFLDFDDIRAGKLEDVDVVINAGRAGTAWSGGDAWKDPKVVSALTAWTLHGGVFVGIGEPSAVDGYEHYFRMAPVLGVDEDTGARVCEGRYAFSVEEEKGLIPEGAFLRARRGRYLTDGAHTRVLAAENLTIAGYEDPEPALLMHPFGEGKGVYLSSFEFSFENARMLFNVLLLATGHGLDRPFVTDNAGVECAYFPASSTAVLANNLASEETASVRIQDRDGREKRLTVTLAPYETKFVEVTD